MSVTLPSEEDRQRAKWSLLILDIEYRTEQVRQLKRYEPLRLVFTGLGAAAAFMVAGFALAKLFG